MGARRSEGAGGPGGTRAAGFREGCILFRASRRRVWYPGRIDSGGALGCAGGSLVPRMYP
eukprot:839334-Prorocentrum_minimum.AAC.1